MPQIERLQLAKFEVLLSILDEGDKFKRATVLNIAVSDGGREDEE